MKSLDPSSTVREAEFESAAKSAGVWEKFKTIPANKIEGEILSGKQREEFKKLMNVYLANKGKQYDRLYDDMERVTNLSGIPKEYLPRRASGDIAGTQPTSIQGTNGIYTY